MSQTKQEMTPYLAVSRAEGFDGGENATREEQIEAWQYIIDNELWRGLQGFFGRTCKALIEQGICKAKGAKS